MKATHTSRREDTSRKTESARPLVRRLSFSSLEDVAEMSDKGDVPGARIKAYRVVNCELDEKGSAEESRSRQCCMSLQATKIKFT